ncbi:MAG: bifunctional pyr operon transcriptional regulator/uracil phosphoribosyltransferase PyrR [Terriglobia bacterium]
MPFQEKSQLMSAAEIDRTLVRLAHEIVEKAGPDPLALVGIRRRGVPLAQRLAARIAHIESRPVDIGILDITLYRDDLSLIAEQPVVRSTELTFPLDGKTVILVDDVLYTGRTTRAALDALFDFGRPNKVQLCVLIDRGGRELPVEATYVGRFVQTHANETVEVRLREIDQEDRVFLVEKLPD